MARTAVIPALDRNAREPQSGAVSGCALGHLR